MESESNVAPEQSQLQLMMAYAAELELEVDRLRRRDQFLRQQTGDHLKEIRQRCYDAESHGEAPIVSQAIIESCTRFADLLRDIKELPGYHPAFDQVVAIAVGPLADQVFRWQQRYQGIQNAVLRLDLQPDHVDWFPARFRHILDNLISNALRYCDQDKGEVRIGLSLRARPNAYELTFTDNGRGMPRKQSTDMLELFYRAAPTRAAGLGVGLAVVKLMVEQCCGTIAVSSGEGQGTSVTLMLPRYDIDDHVD